MLEVGQHHGDVRVFKGAAELVLAGTARLGELAFRDVAGHCGQEGDGAVLMFVGKQHLRTGKVAACPAPKGRFAGPDTGEHRRRDRLLADEGMHQAGR